MANESRPFSKQYEGQRVSAIPDGFLQAYANVGSNIMAAGKGLGEGLGMAVGAYMENKFGHEKADATAEAAAAWLPDVSSTFEKKIAATKAETVKKSTENPESADPDVLAYRALVKAKDSMTTSLSKWSDLSLSKKEAFLGQMTIYKKMADDQTEIDTKAAAAAQAQSNFNEGMDLKRQTEARQANAQRNKDAPYTSEGVLSNALTKTYTEGDNSTPLAIDQGWLFNISETLKSINAQINSEGGKAEPNVALIKSLIATREQFGKEYNSVASTVIEAQSGVRAEIENYQTAVADPTKAKAVLEQIDGRISELTVNRGKIPQPVKKEVDRLTAQRNELAKAIEVSDKNKSPVLVSGQHIREANASALNADRAVQVWTINAEANGLPVTPEAQRAVKSMAYFDGTVTEDGMKVDVDKKTGAINLTEDPIWTKWWSADPKNMTPKDQADFAASIADKNERSRQLNLSTFGTHKPDGTLVPTIAILDTFNGKNNVYVSGVAGLPKKQMEEVRTEINKEAAVQGALDGLKNALVKRNTDGTIMYVTNARTGEVETDKDGYPIPQYRDISKLSSDEKRNFETKVATFIRTRADGLGVLSKTDWDWLRSQAPSLSATFSENFNVKEEGAAMIAAQAVVTALSVTTPDFINRIDSQTEDLQKKARMKLSAIPTVDGKGYLTVTSGVARDLQNNPYSGRNLQTWYEQVSTSGGGVQDLTYPNEFIEADRAMLVSYHAFANGKQGGKEAFAQAQERWTALLRSKGVSPAQIEELKTTKFPTGKSK